MSHFSEKLLIFLGIMIIFQYGTAPQHHRWKVELLKKYPPGCPPPVVFHLGGKPLVLTAEVSENQSAIKNFYHIFQACELFLTLKSLKIANLCYFELDFLNF